MASERNRVIKGDENISLFISQSTTTSLGNKTGSWRFARPVYMNRTAPCSTACPAGVDIPRVEHLISQGLLKKAWELFLWENPFPAVSGRVCFHTCENACNRKAFDHPIAINCLERFIGDTALSDGSVSSITPLPANNRTIAIAGSGPAGLSAAYFLTLLGFSCEIFEEKSEPGGVLRWGIPSYRLPKDILSKEIQRIEEMGVKIHCNHSIDKAFVKGDRTPFDAVYLGFGFGRPLVMGIQGEELLADGLAFLEDVQHNRASCDKKDVAVIGGGNTAIDVARTLVRMGASATIVYRRTRKDMPAFEHEIQMAENEGVRIVELVSPVSVEKEGDHIHLHLQQMKSGEKGIDGRSTIVPDGDKTSDLYFSKVYSGIGATVKETWHLPEDNGHRQVNLSHSAITFGQIPIVYGGDLVTDTKSVTDAVASGKQAAMALCTYFEKGADQIKEDIQKCRVGDSKALSMEMYLGRDRANRDSHVVDSSELNFDYFLPQQRVAPKRLLPEKAGTSFNETEQTLSADQARQEAQRCIVCGYCNDCDNCRIFCPEVSVKVENNIRRIDLDYCKGCGVCTVECPRSAMRMEEEKA